MTKIEAKCCVYCGSFNNLSCDHIPPKNLFSKPRPKLITVPCCETCNGEASKDDEYFRLMIAIRHDTGDHPEVRKLWPGIHRSLERRKRYGFTQSLLRSMMKIEVTTPSGLYLGHVPGYDVNLVRLDRVASRIAKGLFFHEFGARLPDKYEVVAYSESGLRAADAVENVRDICTKLTASPPKTVGKDVFYYWFARTPEDSNVTAWLFNFYKKVSFICLTLPEQAVAACGRRSEKAPTPG